MTYRAVTTPPDWETLMNRRVRLHRNLRTKWIVIQTYQKGKGWAVVGATQSCLLQDVHFIINQKRYQWIIENGKRHVYAHAEGTMIAIAATDWNQTPVPLGCNPFKMPGFYDKRTEKPIQDRAAWLSVIDNEVFVSLDACFNSTAFETRRSLEFSVSPPPFLMELCGVRRLALA